MSKENGMNEQGGRLIRLPELQAEYVPLSKASIYKLMKAGKFPLPQKIGQRAVAWRENSILDYIRTLQEI
jgi:prophage regulatory protein